jgi:hypothetical protein
MDTMGRDGADMSGLLPWYWLEDFHREPVCFPQHISISYYDISLLYS